MKKCFNTAFFDFERVVSKIQFKDYVKDCIKQHTNISRMNCSYYNKLYPDRVLCKTLMYEYLMDLMGNDKMYIDINELRRYLDDVFDNQ